MMTFRFDLFLSLIRAVFPRWDFFDRIAYQFDLEFQKDSASSWERLSFQQNQTLRGLFINTDLNEALAQMNLLDHFARDVQELQKPDEAPALTSYRLVESLLWEKAPPAASKLKFRLVAVSPKDRMILYASSWLRRPTP
ncbi:MAG TPA: hypothetical protein PL182_01855 [Pseudobdellovibrionaceae bacterium]|nr:hypothetical protein [Pseudobdellovibrionaceae bacterium]